MFKGLIVVSSSIALCSVAGAQQEVRSIDGSGNNLQNPLWGAANTELVRGMSVDYTDGVSSPAGADRASAREISNKVVAQTTSILNSVGASDMVWQWGQFLDHDIDLTGGASPAEPFDIPVPLGDPWFDPYSTGVEVIPLNRSLYDPLSLNPWRNQINEITAFIDASSVYGSDQARADEIKLPTGQLNMSPNILLPFNVNGLPNAPDSSAGFFLAGDIRANEQVALTAMHTLFAREHNRQARKLYLTGTTDPTTIYETARMIVSAEMQAITYREFLPVLLGPNALPPYQGYDPAVNPGIRNGFSTASYRFGHSMLSAVLLRLDANLQTIPEGNLPLANAFFNPQELIDHGIEPLLRGLATQPAQEVDVFLVDDVRNLLFGPPGAGGLDLASLNIQRGRDHGLPSYNQARVDMGLAARTTFAEVSSNPAVVAALADAYDTVEDIDLWVGGLAEDHVPGAMVGELLHVVFVDQFTRLRDGDRFWYELTLPPPMQQYVNLHTLSAIIRRNTKINLEIGPNVFIAPSGS